MQKLEHFVAGRTVNVIGWIISITCEAVFDRAAACYNPNRKVQDRHPQNREWHLAARFFRPPVLLKKENHHEE